jgi:hypothetical protein
MVPAADDHGEGHRMARHFGIPGPQADPPRRSPQGEGGLTQAPPAAVFRPWRAARPIFSLRLGGFVLTLSRAPKPSTARFDFRPSFKSLGPARFIDCAEPGPDFDFKRHFSAAGEK